MSRQAQITKEQIRSKVYQAETDIQKWLKAATERGISGEEYRNALKMLKKAIYDKNLWEKVLESL